MVLMGSTSPIVVGVWIIGCIHLGFYTTESDSRHRTKCEKPNYHFVQVYRTVITMMQMMIIVVGCVAAHLCTSSLSEG